MQAVLLATVVATGLLQSLADSIKALRYSSFMRLVDMLTKCRYQDSTAHATNHLSTDAKQAMKNDAKAICTAAALHPDNPPVDSESSSGAQGSQVSAYGRHCLDNYGSE